MQEDKFSVEVKGPDGNKLPVIMHNGQQWVVGEPGQDFTVVVHMTMTNVSQTIYRVGLKLDGQTPGYSFIFSSNNLRHEACFHGWLAQTGDASNGPTSYRSFKFGTCRPSAGASIVNSPDEIAAGKIEVILDQVVPSGQQQSHMHLQAAGPGSGAVDKKLPEGKKWFLAPGLKAEAGTVTTSTTNWNRNVYITMGSLPSIKLRYNSSESMLLCKMLNPRVAAHRAILRKSVNPSVRAAGGPEPQEKEQEEEEEENSEPEASSERAPNQAAAAAAAAAAAPAGGQPKREGQLGVKREYGADEPVLRSATAEKIDLTEQPIKALVVNGQEVGADELAVCDLVDSEDGDAAPRWQIKKKQHIEVDA